MKNIFLLMGQVMTILFFSCESQKLIKNKTVDGIYYAKVKKYDFTTLYTLVLNKDSTFFFDIRIQDGNPKCEGKWKILDNKVLMLECEEANVFEALTNGYMSQREHNIQVINKNKLKYKDIVLKRQNK